MQLRITKTTAGTVTTLRVDGELTDEGVAELERACASVDGSVDLDLSQLMKADPSLFNDGRDNPLELLRKSET